VHAASNYKCMRPYATSVCGLTLLVYAALRYKCMRPYATSVCGLTLLVYAALRYYASDLMRAGTQQIVGDYKRGVQLLVYEALSY
jgi:hypothetical protein